MSSSNLQQAVQVPFKITEDERLFAKSVPVFINVRDRLDPLVKLLDWLNRAGHSNIVLINNVSSYPPLLKFLDACSCRIVNLKRNIGKTALWRIPEFKKIIEKGWFVYTDSDVVPVEACPLDAVAYFYCLLQRFPNYLKAGFGLRLDDIQDRYHLKQDVIQWESGLYGRELAPGIFQADIDTTFALYRPHTPCIEGPAMRTRGIYEARHLPWYVDSANPDEEEIYYQAHARLLTRHWKLHGDTNGRPKVPKVAGGIAARIESDPQALLADILSSKFGRVMVAYRMIRRMAGKPAKLWRTGDYTTPAKAEQAILEIITSDDWRAVTKLAAPLRALKLKIASRRTGQA